MLIFGRGTMAQEVVITYETLFELLQRERERMDLQKLEPTFYQDTIAYVRDKRKILEATKNDSSPFAAEERKKTERQLENIHKILKELYERREKKIISIALDKSRTKSKLIDTSALLKEEKVVFDSVCNLLDSYRDAILSNLLNEKMPFMDVQAPAMQLKREEMYFKSASEMKRKTKLLRFLSQVPKFVGPELEEYGPYQEDDIANLPSEIADVLLGKSKVEEIQSE